MADYFAAAHLSHNVLSHLRFPENPVAKVSHNQRDNQSRQYTAEGIAADSSHNIQRNKKIKQNFCKIAYRPDEEPTMTVTAGVTPQNTTGSKTQ